MRPNLSYRRSSNDEEDHLARIMLTRSLEQSLSITHLAEQRTIIQILATAV